MKEFLTAFGLFIFACGSMAQERLDYFLPGDLNYKKEIRSYIINKIKILNILCILIKSLVKNLCLIIKKSIR